MMIISKLYYTQYELKQKKQSIYTTLNCVYIVHGSYFKNKLRTLNHESKHNNIPFPSTTNVMVCHNSESSYYAKMLQNTNVMVCHNSESSYYVYANM